MNCDFYRALPPEVAAFDRYTGVPFTVEQEETWLPHKDTKWKRHDWDRFNVEAFNKNRGITREVQKTVLEVAGQL